MEGLEEFVKALAEDPSLIAKLKKKAELEEFKSQYNLGGASPLKCPVCAGLLQSPGTLWINRDDNTRFVCRKCRLEFTLICNTIPNDKLISRLRLIGKGIQVQLHGGIKSNG